MVSGFLLVGISEKLELVYYICYVSLWAWMCCTVPYNILLFNICQSCTFFELQSGCRGDEALWVVICVHWLVGSEVSWWSYATAKQYNINTRFNVWALAGCSHSSRLTVNTLPHPTLNHKFVGPWVKFELVYISSDLVFMPLEELLDSVLSVTCHWMNGGVKFLKEIIYS